MEILLDERLPTVKKSSSQGISRPSQNVMSSRKKVVAPTRKQSAEFDELLSVTSRASIPALKKKVVKKRVVKKVVRKRVPEASPGILAPLTDFSLDVRGSLPISDPPPSNPYSFFQDDDTPPSLPSSELPDLSSDSEENWETKESSANDFSHLDMLLNLPDASNDGISLPDISDEEEAQPLARGSAESETWKTRALTAERDAAIWKTKYLEQKEGNRTLEARVETLHAKEKADAEQMDQILQKVEKNLQISRSRYEERMKTMQHELGNAKRMIQHLTQSEDIRIPDNFEEYQEFIQNGKAKAIHASETLQTLAENAESQVQQLLKGCQSLKTLSLLLASVDRFADQPDVPPQM